MAFSDGMKKRRKELRMTQKELFEISGVPQSTISAVEKGDRIPTEDTMAMIAAGLRCSVGYLMGEKNAAELIVSGPDDEEMLRLFHQLSLEKQEYVKGVLEGLSAAHKQ